MRAVLVYMLLGVVACMPFGRGPGNRAELATVAAELVHVAEGGEGRRIAWVGIRDASGEQTEETKALDDYLVSALLRAGVSFTLSDSSGEKWADERIIGATGRDQQLLLGGRLQDDEAWMYVRLFLVDASSDGVLQMATRRVDARQVDGEVAQRARAQKIGSDGLPLDVDLHIVVLRSEGGIRRRIELVEGGRVQEGDDLQVRFRLSRDAQVYAFLYSSEGEVIELMPDQFAYSGLLHYGPGENRWLGLDELDRVYTLYFMAGPRLFADNSRSEFFERLDELVEQGQVNRFVGLEKQDGLLLDFLRRAFQGEIDIRVIRLDEEMAVGAEETFVYGDGTRLQSQAEKLRGTPLVVRALSFVVQ